MSFLFGKNRLRKAIEKGLANGRLPDELRELGDLVLTSRADADAVCWGLKQLGERNGTSLHQNARALAGLFQDIDGAKGDAFRTLRERGVPELLKLFDEISRTPDSESGDTLLFILKILAVYNTEEGALKIVEAARRPLDADAYMWSVVLGCFMAGHPAAAVLYRGLCDPLPPGFIGIALLDAANTYLRDEGKIEHPYDSEEGNLRLRQWLTGTNPDEYSYARSATASLPFITGDRRDELLNLAVTHPDVDVKIMAAWATAKIGQEPGLLQLADYCCDFKHSKTAEEYLRDLGREDVIPPAAKEPGFAAMAEFSQWLAHPHELGQPPDDLEIIDHRMLAWPPERELKPFWLIKYRVKDATGGEDDIGCGLVGSMTWCFFSHDLVRRPPEDAYAGHCYWEMEQAGLIKQSNADEYPSSACDTLLKLWHGLALKNPQICYVAEISPTLNLKSRQVAVASARLVNDEGWVLLDDDKSVWYPQSEMPPETSAATILGLHVGRKLLGFTLHSDPKRHLH